MCSMPVKKPMVRRSRNLRPTQRFFCAPFREEDYTQHQAQEGEGPSSEVGSSLRNMRKISFHRL